MFGGVYSVDAGPGNSVLECTGVTNNGSRNNAEYFFLAPTVGCPN
jgi:hypothetical protein